jgi:hypothetical protein
MTFHLLSQQLHASVATLFLPAPDHHLLCNERSYLARLSVYLS